MRVVLCKSAGKNQQLRIKEIHDGSTTHGQMAGERFDGAKGSLIPGVRSGNDFLAGRKIPVRGVAHQSGSVGVGLKASRLAAGAGRARRNNLDMAQGIGEEMASPIETSADIAPAAHASSQRDADKITGIFRRPKMLFGDSQSVGIVLDGDRQAGR